MSTTCVLEVPQDILDSARLTIADLKVEMAVYLYAQERLSIGKARELAGMPLSEANLPIHILTPGDFIQQYYPLHEEYPSLPPQY